MNEAQSTNLPEKRNIESAALATDEVFVLSPVTIDGVSIAAGVLCLVTPGGETVRVPVDRERIGAVARALMTHPAVLLLAREGVALPKAMESHRAQERMLELQRTLNAAQAPAKTYADGVNDSLRAIAKVASTLARSTDRMALDAAAQAVKELLGGAPKAPAVPFDPAVHVTRAEVVADLHRLSIHTDSERVECHESGNRDGAAALQRVDTCIAKVCAKYEVRA